MKCDYCDNEMEKVIYLGLPMRLCSNEECNTVCGFWTFVLDFYFDGYFYYYEGNYLRALWDWFTEDFQ